MSRGDAAEAMQVRSIGPAFHPLIAA